MSEQQDPGARGDGTLPQETAAPPPTPSAPDPGAGATAAAAEGRELRKDDTAGVVTGVCAGIGAFTGIDPVVWRVAFATTALAGGTGLWLYIAAWLMMRDSSGGPAMMEQLLNRRLAARAVLALVALGLAVATALSLVGGFSWGTLVLATPLILGLFVAQKRGVDLSRLARELPTLLKSTEPAPTAPAPDLTPAYFNPAQPWAQAPSGPIDLKLVGDAASGADPASGAADDPEDDPDDADDPAGTAGGRRGRRLVDLSENSRWGHDHRPRRERHEERRRRRREQRERRGVRILSVLCWILFPVTVVAVYTFDASLATVLQPHSGPLVAGALVTAVGVALLVGTWAGDSRGLITFGTLLTVFAVVASTVNVSALRFGGETWQPDTVAQAEAGFALTGGDATVDLTGVPVGPGERVRVNADVRFGRVMVLVPETARVETHSTATFGEVSVDGETRVGTGLDVRRTLPPSAAPTDTTAEPPAAGGGSERRRSERKKDSGAPAADPPTLIVRIQTYGGEVEVRRVPS